MVDRGRPYRDISGIESGISILPSIPIYFFFADHLDQPFRGFVAGVSLSIIILLIFVLRPLIGKREFWAGLILIAAAHIILVCFLPYTGTFSYGFALFPLFFVDAYLSARFIIKLCGARL